MKTRLLPRTAGIFPIIFALSACGPVTQVNLEGLKTAEATRKTKSGRSEDLDLAAKNLLDLPPPALSTPRVLVPLAGDADLLPLNEDTLLSVDTGSYDEPGKWAKRVYFRLFRNFNPVGKVGIYNPSKADPSHHYCYVWAPAASLNKKGKIQIYFSATRGPRGSSCPPDPSKALETVAKMQIYSISLDLNDIFELESPSPDTVDVDAGAIMVSALSASRPRPVQSGSEGRIEPGFAKIDPFEFKGRLLYASANLKDLALGTENVEMTHSTSGIPAPSWGSLLVNGASFGRIAEGPAVFSGPKQDYLLFQGLGWWTNYSVFYKSAKTIDGINSSTAAVALMPAVAKKNCQDPASNACYHRNYGINRVFAFQGRHYVYYHVMDMGQIPTRGIVRDGWIAPLVIDDKQRLVSPTRLDLRLNRAKGFKYALDLELLDGQVIGDCLTDAKLPAIGARFFFNGRCVDGRFIGVETIAKLILRSTGDNWATMTAESHSVDFWQPSYLMAPAKPDLVIKSVQFNPTTLKNGKRFAISLRVTNNGSAPVAAGTWVGAFISSDGFSGTWAGSQLKKALAPGAGITISTPEAQKVVAKQGSWTLSARLDDQKLVDELSETNNEIFKTFKVK